MWRTVVFAGAMLAVPVTASAQTSGEAGKAPGTAAPADTTKKVVAKKKKKKKKKKRPRPPTDPCAAPVGRGFILS